MSTQAKTTTTPKTVPVTVENFVRAETDAYFKKYATGPGRELGKIMFRRDVSPVDDQTIVRQNVTHFTEPRSSISTLVR